MLPALLDTGIETGMPTAPAFRGLPSCGRVEMAIGWLNLCIEAGAAG